MRRIITVLVVLVLLFLAGYVPKVPGWLDSYSSKHGRVVDTSHNGIPGVRVVALGEWSSGGLYTTSASCVYSVIATTDANGAYQLPSAWSRFVPGAPWFDQHNGWRITAVKPGYAFAGDQARLVMDPNRPAPPTYGTAARPVTASGTFSKAVSDLVLEQASFTLDQKIYYEAQTAWVGGGCPEVVSPEFHQLRRDLFQDLQHDVCAADAPSELSSSSVLALRSFSSANTDTRAVSWFDQQMTQADPAYGEILREPNQPHTYKTADVCKLMTAVGHSA